jgi:hypothetical protein
MTGRTDRGVIRDDEETALTAELNLSADLLACINAGGPWIEYGIVEHRSSQLNADAYQVLRNRFGQTRPKKHYTTPFYLALALALGRMPAPESCAGSPVPAPLSAVFVHRGDGAEIQDAVLRRDSSCNSRLQIDGAHHRVGAPKLVNASLGPLTGCHLPPCTSFGFPTSARSTWSGWAGTGESSIS